MLYLMLVSSLSTTHSSFGYRIILIKVIVFVCVYLFMYVCLCSVCVRVCMGVV